METNSLEGSTTFDEDVCVDSVYAPYMPFFDELVEDAIWDVCFEVHRIAQHGIYFVYAEQKNLDDKVDITIVDNTVKDGPAKDGIITCPICEQKYSATKYTTHLAKCFGSGRQSSKVAQRRIKETAVGESGTEDESNKGKSKKQGKKKLSKGQSSPKPSLTLEDFKKLSSDEREEFLRKHCGVMSKKKMRTMCKNSLKCPSHKEEDQRSLRMLLEHCGDQTANDEHIDVGTVDEGMFKNQLF